MEALKYLVRDNKNQLSHLNTLSNLLQQRIDYFKQIITTYQKQEKEVAENMMASDTGLYLATQVRILTITIQNGEFILLN
ncbi:TPA: CHASE3 domain-containing protein [Legionella pneumophila]|uniref:CHASE3 domain-containing protein n=2 Tax=Legionella pneumophila TaxID=446 RepID=A0AAN5Q4D1_LEGPN|nr:MULTISPECIES: CHASE3 domain-containing protein [Legionella]WBV64684.1 CHASE3 domain-containing protein [Legionella pneumophila 130b]MCK1848600.1 CHASE3 domain-containing protein [Legionella pneumophila]MCW8388975.1 CHASE3 domain-containing protein [Legionella pneumophila]MCW8466997.1 CHASE3 domain-containing protein [Legionella pneumophila]MCW8476662.1 CHASE3 domain-containing protein [Legionella pneumophila]